MFVLSGKLVRVGSPGKVSYRQGQSSLMPLLTSLQSEVDSESFWLVVGRGRKRRADLSCPCVPITSKTTPEVTLHIQFCSYNKKWEKKNWEGREYSLIHWVSAVCMLLWELLPGLKRTICYSSLVEWGTLLVANTASERGRHCLANHLHWEHDAWLGKGTSPTLKWETVCISEGLGKGEILVFPNKLCSGRTLCWHGASFVSLCSLFTCQFLTYKLIGSR